MLVVSPVRRSPDCCCTPANIQTQAWSHDMIGSSHARCSYTYALACVFVWNRVMNPVVTGVYRLRAYKPNKLTLEQQIAKNPWFDHFGVSEWSQRHGEMDLHKGFVPLVPIGDRESSGQQDGDLEEEERERRTRSGSRTADFSRPFSPLSLAHDRSFRKCQTYGVYVERNRRPDHRQHRGRRNRQRRSARWGEQRGRSGWRQIRVFHES